MRGLRRRQRQPTLRGGNTESKEEKRKGKKKMDVKTFSKKFLHVNSS
jgi:hypothetical protein